jgi:membrane-bound metal-dependent hydrolase YbcI (DUF457 family)
VHQLRHDERVCLTRVDPGNTAFTPLAFESYPWSHSLLMVLLWAILAGIAVSTRLRSAPAGVLVAAVVVSHWVADVVVAALIAVVTAIWAIQPWSPPPPGPDAVAIVGLALWLLPLWAAWIERHRLARALRA